MGYNLQKSADKSGTFDPLPEGRYTCTIGDIKVGKSSNNNETINVTFTVADGEHKNRKAWNTFTMTEKALPFVINLLRAVDKADVISESVEVEDIVGAIRGKTVSVYADIGSNGKGGHKNILSQYQSAEAAEEEEGGLFD